MRKNFACHFFYCLVVLLLLSSLCCLSYAEQAWTQLKPGVKVRELVARAAAKGPSTKLFASLPPEQTGIDFVEQLDWDHPQGQLFYTGYACGGIAVGDVDGNGLPDLFFASGPSRNRLYLQLSPWKFVERGIQANVAGGEGTSSSSQPWSTGATLLDIDNDGDLDIYVCNYDAANRLHINRGDGTFDERATDYGLDIVDASLIASVADYDRDGDVDIYLAMNRYLDEREFSRRDLFFWRDGMELLRPAAEKYFTIRRFRDQPGQLNMWAGRTDRLLRNEGPGKPFVDVSESMKLERGDTLSTTWWDYDHDGWPDLYVANDLAAPDRLFRNNRDGTFQDVALESLPHTPWQAMGSSAGDINGDGLVDFLVADMSFRTHFKDKVFMGDMSAKFRNISVFPHDQLMRNALYVNSGTQHFQEAAFLAGVASTDWTWTAKLADLDNDGRLDAFFTNGSPVNLAGANSLEAPLSDSGSMDTSNLRRKYRSQAPVLEQNLAYRNAGELSFADQSDAWGLADVGMSFAAVHADLDRDGDLDLVVANLNEPPSVYRNNSTANGMLVRLRGTHSNRNGFGAEVSLHAADAKQVQQVYPVAGFQSCQESIVHFGLGEAAKNLRLTIRWPSGIVQELDNLQGGRLYEVEEPREELDTRQPRQSQVATTAVKPLFTPVTDGLNAEHHEQPFDDFERQPLLPNKLSQLGPPLACGDVDNDGDLDLFVGEASSWMGMLYLNQGNFQFEPSPQLAFAQDGAAEDRAAVFLDANGDGNLDLLVGSGSVEQAPGSEVYRDRLYLGDGKGGFVRAADTWMPDLRMSTGVMAATDYDRDGDVDVFVGARSIPGEYPRAPEHALLRNEGDLFANVIELVAPTISLAGMVTDAVWADVNADGWEDLVVATDWGPIRLYLNREGKLVEATDDAGLASWTGWWQSVACADIDNDGDLDLVAGNFGLNTKYKASLAKPVLAYYGEYGSSGKKNFIEAKYENDTLFPIRGRSCSSAAMPHLAKQFSTYADFARATLPEIYTPSCLQSAERFEVNTLESACLLNDGQGRFEMIALPRAAQLAPIFDLAISDLDGDGVLDLFLGQNFFTPQRETGPMDGGLGVVAIGNGDGSFETLRPDEAGIAIVGDAKAVVVRDFDRDGRNDVCVATNDGPLRSFRYGENQATTVNEPAQNPKSVAWRRQNVTLAEQFIQTGQYEQSLPYLRRALKASPNDAKALLLLAISQRELGEYAKASELFAALLARTREENAVVLAEYGRLYFSMRQYDRAERQLAVAFELAPETPHLRDYLGDLRRAQGRLAEARLHYVASGSSGSLDEVEKQAQVAQLTVKQAKIAQRSRQVALAIKLYEKSIRLDAQPSTLIAYAQLLRDVPDERFRDTWYAEELLRSVSESQGGPTRTGAASDSE